MSLDDVERVMFLISAALDQFASADFAQILSSFRIISGSRSRWTLSIPAKVAHTGLLCIRGILP